MREETKSWLFIILLASPIILLFIGALIIGLLMYGHNIVNTFEFRFVTFAIVFGAIFCLAIEAANRTFV